MKSFILSISILLTAVNSSAAEVSTFVPPEKVLNAIRVIDAAFGKVDADAYELDVSEKCELLTNKSDAVKRACDLLVEN